MHRAHLERLRNQQRMLATDTLDHTPGSGHDFTNFQVSGWMGGMSTWYRSMLPSAPTLPPHGYCSGHGASKVLSGTGIARTACRPLRPRLASGLLRVDFGLSLEKGAAWRLPARRDSSSTLSSLAIRRVPFLQLTLEIRVLHVQSTQLALKPFNPFAQFANRLPPGPEHVL